MTSSQVLRWADAYKNAQCVTLIENDFENGFKTTLDFLNLLISHHNTFLSKLSKKSGRKY